MKMDFLSILALAFSCLPTPAVAQTGETDRVAGLLASDLIRSAFMALRDEPLTVEMIEASVVLVEEALAIQPNNADRVEADSSYGGGDPAREAIAR